MDALNNFGLWCCAIIWWQTEPSHILRNASDEVVYRVGLAKWLACPPLTR